MRKKELDLELVKKHLYYDPHTGLFHRLKAHRTVKVGDIAGSPVESSTKPGKFYIRIGVLGKYVWAHRLAWAIMTGNWPKGEIDHIDQNSENNIYSNLRECTKEINAKNLSRYRNNSTGFPGVSKRDNGKYRSRIMVNKKPISLGDWDTIEEAVNARESAKRKYGFHENHC